MDFVKMTAPVTGCIVYVAPENAERFKKCGYKEAKQEAAKPKKGKAAE